jgi:hypothetical protein
LSFHSVAQISNPNSITLGLQTGTITNRFSSSSGSTLAKTFATRFAYQFTPHSFVGTKIQFIRYRVDGLIPYNYTDDIQHIDACILYNYIINPKNKLQCHTGAGLGISSTDYIPDARNYFSDMGVHTGNYLNETQPVVDTYISLQYSLSHKLFLGTVVGNKTFPMDFYDNLIINFNEDVYFLPYFTIELALRIN